MTLHAIIEYLKYRLRAKNRHGVHSPFTYHLNDTLLRDRSKKTLIDKIYAHYGDTFSIQEIDVGDALPALQDKLLIIVKNIHINRAATAAWQAMHQDPRVPFSIDLYQIGLLFFDAAFKEKQHFTLRCLA